jgi:hypothetical protein
LTRHPVVPPSQKQPKVFNEVCRSQRLFSFVLITEQDVTSEDIFDFWFDIFNNLKRANDNSGLEGWFIFLYNGRKEICGVAEKVLDKDNPEVVGKFKYYLVMY